MRRVLVIEDQMELRENIAEILELADYEVQTALHGKAGVSAARHWQPDVILCDIMMPELDGYGVLHMLSRDPQTASIPFIFLTAKTERESLRKGMAMGADDYLTKPFEDSELLDAIEARIRRVDHLTSASRDADSLSGLLSGSPEEALRQLRETCRKRTVKKKENLYHQGDDSHFLYFLLSGQIKRVRGDAFGKELVTDVLQAGTFFGHYEILAEVPHQDEAVAMTESEVELIPAADLRELIRNNREVSAHFLKWIAARVNDQEERLLKLAYQPVRERAADALLMLFDQQAGDTIHVSRDDLASMVGTATESLIRVLSTFKSEGFIDASGRAIRLMDRQGLQDQILG